MPAPTINDLRAVALQLPGNERINAGEVADILSAALALSRYGKGLLDAVNAGTVSDFFHERIVADAKARNLKNPDGTDFIPRRGANASTPAPAPTSADVGNVAAQLAQLTQLVQDLSSRVSHDEQTSNPEQQTTESETGSSTEPDSENMGGIL